MTYFFNLLKHSAFQVFLQQAEHLGLRKKLLTGGITEFKYDERMSYEGSDDPTTFFTSGERQSMILEMVNDLRAVQGDELGKIKFVEGQQIGKRTMNVLLHENIFSTFSRLLCKQKIEEIKIIEL